MPIVPVVIMATGTATYTIPRDCSLVSAAATGVLSSDQSLLAADFVGDKVFDEKVYSVLGWEFKPIKVPLSAGDKLYFAPVLGAGSQLCFFMLEYS